MKILFQGDSITDAFRDRENDNNAGIGYPLLIKAEMGFDNPGEYEFFNRGISGDRIVDIYARMKSDILNIRPDLMSILVGVNDVWHELHENPNGIDADKFYKIYDMLIEEILEELPQCKIIMLEPFVLRGEATNEKWDYFKTEVRKRAEKAKKIAEKYSIPFVPLQEGFNELSKKAPCDYWLRDGVHPTSAGHQFIKSEWLKVFNNTNLGRNKNEITY